MEYLPPYPWYSDPLPMVYQPHSHGILTPLPMEYQPPLYPWYSDPLSMVYRPPYQWYIDPLTHGISTSLSMIF